MSMVVATSAAKAAQLACNLESPMSPQAWGIYNHVPHSGTSSEINATASDLGLHASEAPSTMPHQVLDFILEGLVRIFATM